MRFRGGTVSLHDETCPPVSELLDVGCGCHSTVGSRGQGVPLLRALRAHTGQGQLARKSTGVLLVQQTSKLALEDRRG